MEQKDYILREIERIGMIMSAIRQKLFAGKKENLSISIQQQIVELKEMLINNANLDYDKFMDLDEQSTLEYLGDLAGFSVENIELLAGIISEIGYRQGSPVFLEKALQLFKICSLRDRTFSLEREEKISQVQSALETL